MTSPTWSIQIPVVFALALFVPGHMLGWAIEWTWLALTVSFAFVRFLVLKYPLVPVVGIAPGLVVQLFCVFTIFGLFGTVYGATVLGLQISPADFGDHVRFLIFIPLFLLVGSIASGTPDREVAGLFKAVLAFNLLCSMVILARVPVLFDLVMSVYAEAKVQYDFGHIRIGVPFANPNFAALIFVLLFSYFAFFHRSPLFALLALVSLALTGSRSGWLAASPVLLLAWFHSFRYALRTPWFLPLFAAVHALIIYNLAVLASAAGGFGRLLELIEALQSGNLLEVQTAAIRFQVVENALSYISDSPWFGIGPGRFYGLDVTDAQLIAWPLMYGVPCGILIAAFFAALFVRTRKSCIDKKAYVASLATGSAFFLMLATGDFMKNYRLFFLTVLVCHYIWLRTSQSRSGLDDRP